MRLGNFLHAAAWVPDETTLDWDQGLQLAVDWTDDRCQEEGACGLLYVEAHAHDYTDGPLGWFAARHAVATRRSRPRGDGRGPVLAYCPEPGWLGDAIRAAHSSSLCIVEGFTPMLGWAMETEALNLLSGEVTVDTRTDEQREMHKMLAFHGNNGWGDSFAKSSTPSRLRELADSGVPLGVTIGVMLAVGASNNGIKNLLKMGERL